MFTILYFYLTCSIFVAHSLKMFLRLLRDLKTVENNN